jgi:class 3 adenylate cyclase
MRPFLKPLHGLLPKSTYELGELTVIGRSEACDISLPFDGISRRHCVIARRGPSYVLMDQASRNGTEVNGKKVLEHVLSSGDRVLIGPYELEFVHDNATERRVDFDEILVEGVNITGANAALSELSATSRPDLLFKALQKFQLVLRMNDAIAQASDGNELFNVLLEQLFLVIPAERGAVLLGNNAEDVRAVAVRTKQGTDERIPISRTLVRRMFTQREALLVLNLATDKRLESKSLITQGVRSVLCAPLIYDGMVVGAVQLDSARIGVFAQEDLQILVGVARQAALAFERSRLIERIRADVTTRINLERYLSKEAVMALNQETRAQGLLGKVGQKRRLVLLFSNLRGFHDMATRVDARYLLETMNEYFARMADHVFRYGGTLDKFVGSGVMAFWGAPQRYDDAAARAVACAIDMQASLVELNAMRSARGQMPLIISVGVHAGEAVVGSIATDRRYDYTAIGPAVTFASHVVGAAQPGEILVSGEVHQELGASAGGEWRLPVPMKGVAKPVALFSLRTLRASPISPGLAKDHRATLRVQTAIAITLSSAKNLSEAHGTMRDVSLKGAGIVIALSEGEDIAEGATIEIACALDGQAFKLAAVVRRVNRVGTEVGNVVHLGVEWTTLDAHARAAIDRLVG